MKIETISIKVIIVIFIRYPETNFPMWTTEKFHIVDEMSKGRTYTFKKKMFTLTKKMNNLQNIASTVDNCCFVKLLLSGKCNKRIPVSVPCVRYTRAFSAF